MIAPCTNNIQNVFDKDYLGYPHDVRNKFKKEGQHKVSLYAHFLHLYSIDY